ncbi:MAG: pilus assembly protein TadG-related protein [bacterium]
MKKPYAVPVHLRGNKGIVAVYVALGLVVFIGFAALAVDVGYLMVSKNELQNAADAAALAATRHLGVIYEPLSYSDQHAYVCNPGDIVPIAQATAASNKAAGQSVLVQGADVVIGKWDGVAKTLTETLNQPNAVRVNARRDTTVGTGIGTFFARIFNINEVSVTATATAALTGSSSIKEGELNLPIGISETWFKYSCTPGQNITFYPTTDSCAGWTNWTDAKNDKVSDPDLKNEIFPGLIDGTLEAAAATLNETEWWFSGGNLSKPTWVKFNELFQMKKDPDSGEWETKVVLYSFSKDSIDSCQNPNPSDGPLPIVGFASFILREVVVPPSLPGGEPQKSIVGSLECSSVAAGRGSGVNYGTMGSIPGLVK